jgi:hypothetical protein
MISSGGNHLLSADIVSEICNTLFASTLVREEGESPGACGIGVLRWLKRLRSAVLIGQVSSKKRTIGRALCGGGNIHLSLFV